jgi:hypothetical protein
MSAPTSRRRDPFQPPGASDPRIELAAEPAKAPAPGTMAPESPPSSARSTPMARRPLEYRRPGVSWVTVVVLGFAAVGIAAVGGTVVKKVTGLTSRTPAPRLEQPAAPVVYQPLAKDDAVLVTIQVSPRTARLMLDGEPLVSNPVRLPRGPKPHTLAATAEGYAPTVEEFSADATKTVHLRLPRARR